ncbi:MAG: hypothetical protein IPM16_23670 [Chloroflexi bacterium]|nr:hypothetical protein [Chloroflexota bacterium]
MNVQTQNIVGSVLPVINSVVGGVMKSGDSGVWGKAREIVAVKEFLENAPQYYGDNDVIRGIVDSLGEFDLKKIDLSTITVEGALGQVAGLRGVLDGLGQTGNDIKQFLYGLAEFVANAAGGGLMGSGTKVTAGEAGFLNSLKATLGL